jgi:excisionase family DNA binding protein
MHSSAAFGTADNDRPNWPTVTRAAYSVRETASLLGICPASVYRALRRGDLEGVMLGGRRLIPARCIDKLLSGKAAK